MSELPNKNMGCDCMELEQARDEVAAMREALRELIHERPSNIYDFESFALSIASLALAYSGGPKALEERT